jgi:DNA-directed RNA polymerase sigma subunit (sigma70/sigma32)
MNSRENSSDSDHESPADVSLSEEEIYRLAVRFERGDTEAVSVLIRAHLALVVSLAQKHLLLSAVPLTRLISAGNNGLMNAIKTCLSLEEGARAKHIQQQIEASIRQSSAQVFKSCVFAR